MTILLFCAIAMSDDDDDDDDSFVLIILLPLHRCALRHDPSYNRAPFRTRLRLITVLVCRQHFAEYRYS